MRPYLFLHIPRTGGTSIANILPAGRSTGVQINKLISVGFKNKNGNSFQHATLDDFPTSTDNLFKFTFVRNPWDRVVSVFEHQVRSCRTSFTIKNRTTGDIVDLNPTQRFSAFIIKLKEAWANGSINTSWDGHLMPQILYTHNEEKRQVVDYIGRFETMKQDLDNLNNLCEWNLQDINIPHLNKSSEKQNHYKNYYHQGNGVAKEIIYQLYRDEIELYGYKF